METQSTSFPTLSQICNVAEAALRSGESAYYTASTWRHFTSILLTDEHVADLWTSAGFRKMFDLLGYAISEIEKGDDASYEQAADFLVAASASEHEGMKLMQKAIDQIPGDWRTGAHDDYSKDYLRFMVDTILHCQKNFLNVHNEREQVVMDLALSNAN